MLSVMNTIKFQRRSLFKKNRKYEQFKSLQLFRDNSCVLTIWVIPYKILLNKNWIKKITLVVLLTFARV